MTERKCRERVEDEAQQLGSSHPLILHLPIQYPLCRRMAFYSVTPRSPPHSSPKHALPVTSPSPPSSNPTYVIGLSPVMAAHLRGLHALASSPRLAHGAFPQLGYMTGLYPRLFSLLHLTLCSFWKAATRASARHRERSQRIWRRCWLWDVHSATEIPR